MTKRMHIFFHMWEFATGPSKFQTQENFPNFYFIFAILYIIYSLILVIKVFLPYKRRKHHQIKIATKNTFAPAKSTVCGKSFIVV